MSIIAPIGGIQKIIVGGSGAAYPPFYPTTLSNLEEYYDSRSPTVAHGAIIDPWIDLSGKVRNMGNMGLPGVIFEPTLLKTSGQSPKGTQRVFWNGENMGLITGTITSFPVATRGHTFYCKAKWRATSSPPAPFAGGVLWNTSLFGSAPKELGIQRVAANQFFFRDNASTLNLGAMQTGELMLTWVFNPPSGTGVCEFYVNGVLVSNSQVWTIAGAVNDTTQLGGAVNVPINCDMDFFLWYTDAHSASQVNKMKTWAQIYWGF